MYYFGKITKIGTRVAIIYLLLYFTVFLINTNLDININNIDEELRNE